MLLGNYKIMERIIILYRLNYRVKKTWSISFQGPHAGPREHLPNITL
jgi:hypothetical protein